MHLVNVVERESTPQGSPSNANQIVVSKNEGSDHGSSVLAQNTSIENGSNKASSNSPSLFKQRQMKSVGIIQPEDLVIVPSAPTLPPAISADTPSKANRLGTVSFYSNVTNCRSPRMALISPSHKSKTLVQLVDGEEVFYEDWWRKMRRCLKVPLFVSTCDAPGHILVLYFFLWPLPWAMLSSLVLACIRMLARLQRTWCTVSDEYTRGFA
jgi:hypothetical protein